MPIEIWTMNEMTLQVSTNEQYIANGIYYMCIIRDRLYIAIKMATHRKFSNREEEKCGAN